MIIKNCRTNCPLREHTKDWCTEALNVLGTTKYEKCVRHILPVLSVSEAKRRTSTFKTSGDEPIKYAAIKIQVKHMHMLMQREIKMSQNCPASSVSQEPPQRYLCVIMAYDETKVTSNLSYDHRLQVLSGMTNTPSLQQSWAISSSSSEKQAMDLGVADHISAVISVPLGVGSIGRCTAAHYANRQETAATVSACVYDVELGLRCAGLVPLGTITDAAGSTSKARNSMHDLKQVQPKMSTDEPNVAVCSGQFSNQQRGSRGIKGTRRGHRCRAVHDRVVLVPFS